MKEFTVIAVSANTNSFGLKSIIILAADGEAWQLLQSAYGTTPLPERGDVLSFKLASVRPQFGSTYECPAPLPPTPAAKAKKILAALQKTNA